MKNEKFQLPIYLKLIFEKKNFTFGKVQRDYLSLPTETSRKKAERRKTPNEKMKSKQVAKQSAVNARNRKGKAVLKVMCKKGQCRA